ERRSRVARPVGDPLVMSEPPTALLYVHAELYRHLLPWPAPRPARDRQAHGLEVEKGERRRELRQRLLECLLHDHPAGLHRLDLARVNRRKLELRREVVDRGVTIGLELDRPPPIDAVQAAHVVVRKLGPAARDERAV